MVGLKFNPTNQPTWTTGTNRENGGNDGRRLMDNGDMVNQLFPSSGRLKTVYPIQDTPMGNNGIGRKE